MADKIPTKYETWVATPEASKWLKDTLASPMGQFLVSVLEERSDLRLNASMPPQFLTINGASLSGRILGYESCMRNLRALAEPGAALPKSLVESYGITHPSQATE